MNEMERRTIPIWKRFHRREINDEEALQLFVKAGVPEIDAREALFIANGGSDVVGERTRESDLRD